MKELHYSLGLPEEIYIVSVDNMKDEMLINCESRKRKIVCIHCGGKTRVYDKILNKKRHDILNGKKVFIVLPKKRFLCKECGKVFTEKITGMEKFRSTDHFNQLVQEKTRNQDYSSVARELKLSVSVVAEKQSLLALREWKVPSHDSIVLGMDGKYLNGEDEIHVVGDVKHREFLGVTETASGAELQKLIKENIVKKGIKVEAVTMDMSKLLKGVATNLFPSVPVIVDRFHVVKYTNHIIDLCRVATEKNVNERFEIKRLLVMKNETLRKLSKKPKWEAKVKKLKGLLKTHNELQILWDLKNRIHAFYQTEDSEAAQEKFENILQFLQFYSSVHPELKDLQKTFLNWKKEILNYFTHRFTNAFIEGLNNRIETLKRKHHGFRNKKAFLSSLCFALFPITLFFTNLIFNH